MPFRSQLYPASTKALGTGWGNGDYGGCGGGTVADRLRSESEGCSAERIAAGSGETSASFYVDSLPKGARRIAESGAVTTAPVFVRSKWKEDASNSPQGAHGVESPDSSVDGGGLVVVSSGAFAFITDAGISQSPEGGGRAWRVEDWLTDNEYRHALVLTAQTPASNSIAVDIAWVDVTWHRSSVIGIYELLAPYLFPGLGTILGGLTGLAIVDVRELERYVHRHTRGRIGWTPKEDRRILRELRAQRWPRTLVLAPGTR